MGQLWDVKPIVIATTGAKTTCNSFNKHKIRWNEFEVSQNAPEQIKNRLTAVHFLSKFQNFRWLRGLDLNQRPSGYEPDELPGCSTPRHQNARPGEPAR